MKEPNLDWFELFWKLYPRKVSKGNASKVWNRLDNKTREIAIEGLRKYIVYWQKKGIEKEYIPHASTWLNPDDERWNDDLSSDVVVRPIVNVEKMKQEIEEDKKIEDLQDRKSVV